MLTILLTLIETEEEKSNFIHGYEKYRYLMYDIANSILNDSHLAEDAVQEAFLRVAKNFSKVDDIDSITTRNYYVVITRNVALTMVKKENYTVDENLIKTKLEKEVLEKHMENEKDLNIIKNVLKMDEKYKVPIYLYYVYGFSSNEISDLMGIKASTVRKQIERGKALLRRVIEAEGM